MGKEPIRFSKDEEPIPPNIPKPNQFQVKKNQSLRRS
jgi:hypothetical protein